MRFDEEKASIVLPALIEAYREKKGVFSQVTLPQWKYLPPWIRVGSLEHAQWLFCLAPFVIANNKSDLVISKVSGILLNQEILTDLFCVGEQNRKFDSYTISHILGELGLKFFTSRNRHSLVENAIWLTQGYRANPLNLYRGVTKIEEFAERFKDFVRHRDVVSGPAVYCRGFGPKVTRLFDNWLGEVHWDDDVGQRPATIGVPMDIWMRRLFLRTGIACPDPGETMHHHSAEIEFRQFAERRCASLGINPAELSGASWILGSSLCSRYKSRAVNPSSFCELWCPIQRLCVYHVPPGEEYENGRVNLNPERRVVMPRLPLFDEEQ